MISSLGCNVIGGLAKACPQLTCLRADYLYDQDLRSFHTHQLTEMQISGSFREESLLSIIGNGSLNIAMISSRALSDAFLYALASFCSSELTELIVECFFDTDMISADAVVHVAKTCIRLEKLYIDCCAAFKTLDLRVFRDLGYRAKVQEEVVADLHWTSTCLTLNRDFAGQTSPN